MATVWHGLVNPPRPGRLWEKAYEPGAVALQQGDEMGRFMLGSTVVLLFPKSAMAFNAQWQAATPVRLGEVMALAS
jgi:phosphatidylserine decarboxylase